MEERKKILVIDDETFIRRLISHVFEREGYIVHTAANGEDGVKLARDIKPDLIFTDVDMPGKNGFQVCQEIREDEELKDVFIIILTGRGQMKDGEKGLAYGANEYIVKPFKPNSIVDKVRKLLSNDVAEKVF